MTMIVGGVRRSCSLLSRRRVKSFGDGSHGALGHGHGLGIEEDAYEASEVVGVPSDVMSIAAGHYHSLALTSSSHIWSWGRNRESQLGPTSSSTPTPRKSWSEARRVQGLEEVKVRGVFASGVISTAVGDDGSLWVWGKSKWGQLGLGKGITESILPSRVEGLAGEKILKVGLGWGHALAQTEDGRLFGWGYCADGRLGKMGKVVSEEMEMPIIWEPSLIHEVDGVEVVDVACGLDHSLVLCRDGSVVSGGNNEYGQLGRWRDKKDKDLMMGVVDVSSSIGSIAAGLGHSLAITKSSEVISWGWNCNGQLGRSTDSLEPLPLKVEGAVSVSGGRAHSLALTNEGQVWVWGCGKNGRLGLGSSNDQLEPLLVESLEDSQILQAVCGFDHTLLLIAH